MKISDLRILRFRSSLFIDVVQLLGYQIGSQVFFFSGESLKGECFSFFFFPVCTRLQRLYYEGRRGFSTILLMNS